MKLKLGIKFWIKRIEFALIFSLMPIYALSLILRNYGFLILFAVEIVLIFLLLLIWIKIYNFKKDLCNKENRIKIYSFFSNTDISKAFYSDTVTWLWWDLKELFHTENYNDEEINALKLFIHGEDQSVAIKDRANFQLMCKHLKDIQNSDERISLLQQEFKNPSHDNNQYKSRRKFRIKDVSLLIYLILITLHLIGCVTTGFDSEDSILTNYLSHKTLTIIENILFYIPTDIIVLLVYFNIVKEKRNR